MKAERAARPTAISTSTRDREQASTTTAPPTATTTNGIETFDGYDFRDALVEKWGYCYDVEFNRVDTFGFRKLYLNILPFRLGRKPWRHATELEYLCHLQAVVEILQKYDQLSSVLSQIQTTDKKPITGRIPIVAVPIRLDLTPSQVQDILGY